MSGDRAAGFAEAFAELAAIGHEPTGGWRRLAWTDEDAAARAWFREQADRRGMAVETDRNGNLWAWWGEPGPGTIATGSHLDTVPGGGAWDGALGIVTAFLAVDALRAAGFRPVPPIVVAAFIEEEGGRFGIPTLGTRLAAGLVDPGLVRARSDPAGVTFAAAMAAAGLDPGGIGPDPAVLGRLDAFVELHVEQGRQLEPLGVPIGIATAIWPHGRWRLRLMGAANHAGTTRLEDRHDPGLALAAALVAARSAATAHGGVATVGRIVPVPNASNVVPGAIDASLDVRAPDAPAVEAIVAGIEGAVRRAATDEGLDVDLARESWSPEVRFDATLRGRVAAALEAAGIAAAEIPTAAGHDAGTLAAVLPTAMLFVRSPNGVSHAPEERAELEDAVIGVDALAAVLADLAGPGWTPGPG